MRQPDASELKQAENVQREPQDNEGGNQSDACEGNSLVHGLLPE